MLRVILKEIAEEENNGYVVILPPDPTTFYSMYV
jgi:hypothetical protein